MKTIPLFLFLFFITLFLKISTLSAQNCQYWSEPQPISDSVTDNINATLVNIHDGSESYYLFWERWMEGQGSEIVYIDIYNQDVPQRVISGNGFTVSNLQVIAVSDYPPPIDTLAYIFYQSNESGNNDIYYVIMKDTGFTAPVPFATSLLDETHLRVSPGGGMIWQEGDKIRFSRLVQNSTGFFFEPVVLVDEGDCRNPDIQNTDLYDLEQYIAWEKGSTDNPTTWYSSWSTANRGWSEPLPLFEDGFHSNIRFSKGIDIASWVPILLSDQIDSAGQYHISGYDLNSMGEFISEFSQEEPFQQDLLTIDFFTKSYWEMGYLAFKQDGANNNSDIFSSDNGFLYPEFNNYCRIDSTSQPDVHPQLFQGAWHFSYFDLYCIWESWRNGHWQIFSATTPVVVGSVPEQAGEGDLKVRAYPNPFDDFLWLEYESGKTCNVTVTIFNTFGQVVKTLDEGYSSNEKSMKKIDMNDVPSGIYLVRIKAGNSVNSIRVIKK